MLIIRKTKEFSLRTLAVITSRANRSYSKDYASSSDDESEPKKRKKEKTESKADNVSKQPEESVALRLNRLLASMNTEDKYPLNKKIDMARPGEANKKRKDAAKEESAAKDVVAAAQRVATLLGEENKVQTESELLAKLLGYNKNETNIVKEKGESTNEKKDLSLSDLIVGMKIDRKQEPREPTRSEFVRRALTEKNKQYQNQQPEGGTRKPMQRSSHKREAETYTGSVNLFGSESLRIFKDSKSLRTSDDMLSTWAHLQQHELKLQIARPPRNYFEKIANWTEQGKVWRFPIDNEQDYKEEVDVDFSEHIFLEQYLEPWCPNKGPIRHFMELVCVGLSKNPYITAKEKKDHILWYRDYFETKKDILKELMDVQKMNAGASEQNTKLET